MTTITRRLPTPRQREVMRILAECDGSVSEAARRLGIRHSYIRAVLSAMRMKRQAREGNPSEKPGATS